MFLSYYKNELEKDLISLKKGNYWKQVSENWYLDNHKFSFRSAFLFKVKNAIKQEWESDWEYDLDSYDNDDLLDGRRLVENRIIYYDKAIRLYEDIIEKLEDKIEDFQEKTTRVWRRGQKND